jgi:hypothetical protein
LLDNARGLLETASEAAAAGCESGEYTIYIGPHGGLEMVAESDASLESYAWNRGATAAWRITKHGGGVRVEGVSGEERCRLERSMPAEVARRILSGKAF